MNKRRLTALAHWLETGARRRNRVEKFNMNEGIRRTGGDADCGTACCIAGAAVMFYADKPAKERLIDDLALGQPLDPRKENPKPRAYFRDSWHRGHGVETAARELLGLDEDQAGELFSPSTIPPDRWGRITPQRAARVIRRLIATGKVKW